MALLRNRLFWVLLFLLLTLAVVYGAFFYLYASFRTRMDEELGARLMAIATATAAAVDDEVWEALRRGDPGAAAAARAELAVIREANGLANIFLFHPDETTLLDLREQYPPGEPNPALLFDVVASTTALAGIPAYTRLYQGETTYLKSGYAPVTGTGGEVVGAVGVEASAGFFAVLRQIRGTLLGAAGVALAAMTLLGFGFSRVLILQGRLEVRLRRTETLASMGQMVAMLAHEIRNPLGIIRGSAETLAERYDLGDDEIYRFIPEEVDRLHRTVSAYLEFARGGSGEGGEDVGEALRRTLDLVAHDLRRKGIETVVDTEAGPFPVRGGSGLLEQAFLNVVLNAMDAMPGGGTLHVSLRRTAPDRVEARLRDTGTGMTAERLRRATEPFFTAKEKGSGLGLAVVRRTVEDTGGRLMLHSTPGAGTTVTLAFPLIEEEARA